jgi:hypothetical protein
MPLSVHARRSLSHGLKSAVVGKQVADIIDANTGTISTDAARRIRFMAANRATGTGIVTKINTSAALSDPERNTLGIILNSRVAANEIAVALAAG